MHFLAGALLFAFGLSPVHSIPRLAVKAPFENYREQQPFERSREQQLGRRAMQVPDLCWPQL